MIIGRERVDIAGLVVGILGLGVGAVGLVFSIIIFSKTKSINAEMQTFIGQRSFAKKRKSIIDYLSNNRMYLLTEDPAYFADTVPKVDNALATIYGEDLKLSYQEKEKINTVRAFLSQIITPSSDTKQHFSDILLKYNDIIAILQREEAVENEQWGI